MTSAGETAAADRYERERREADHRYNDALTALDRAILAAGAQPATGRDDLLALASTLIVFLQQITAFVESKDREVAAHADARMTRVEQGLEPIAELAARLSVLQRTIEGMARGSHQSPVVSHQSQSSVVNPDPPTSRRQAPRDHVYV